MTRLIISTVGTSLLENAKCRDFNSGDHSSLVTFLHLEPQKASAESNALSRLAQPGDELVFLHSDTPEGAVCSEALAGYFGERGFQSRSLRIAGLTYHERGFVQHGLRNFIRLLAQELRAAGRSGRTALINATGGFKAEIAYATAVGLVFQTPVSYIHEMFGDIVTLPATPITWDYSLFAWYGDFFDWLDAEPRPTHEVQGRLNALPEQVALLLDEAEDDHTYLSPLGEAYLEAFRGQEEQRRPLWLSGKAKQAYSALDFTTQGAFRQLIERLQHGQAGDWKRSSEAVQDNIYKFPKGHSPHRLFVREKEGALWVLELSGHSEERRYQQLMNGIRWQDYDPAQFTELQ